MMAVCVVQTDQEVEEQPVHQPAECNTKGIGRVSRILICLCGIWEGLFSIKLRRDLGLNNCKEYRRIRRIHEGTQQ